MKNYVVAYAKITEDKSGIKLAGVYYGGMGPTMDDAEVIAKKCINEVRGGIIMPKILPVSGRNQVIDALYSAAEKLERTVFQMQETGKILAKSRR